MPLLPAPAPLLGLPQPQEENPLQQLNAFVVYMVYGEHKLFFQMSKN